MSKIIEAKQKLQDSKSDQAGLNNVIDYVINFIQDEMFASKVLSEKKSVKEMWQYIVSEARKMATGSAAMVSDNEVYNWAVHYFDEKNIEIDKSVSARTVTTSKQVSQEPTKPVQKQSKPKAMEDDLLMTLDLFGDTSEVEEDYEEEYEEE